MRIQQVEIRSDSLEFSKSVDTHTHTFANHVYGMHSRMRLREYTI